MSYTRQTFVGQWSSGLYFSIVELDDVSFHQNGDIYAPVVILMCFIQFWQNIRASFKRSWNFNTCMYIYIIFNCLILKHLSQTRVPLHNEKMRQLLQPLSYMIHIILVFGVLSFAETLIHHKMRDMYKYIKSCLLLHRVVAANKYREDVQTNVPIC